MISKIAAVGFKGLEFAHDLKKHNLIVGPNGSGKSAISDTIVLTVNGRIPGAGKTNSAIMDAFASNNKMFLGVGIDEAMFQRRFIRNGKGNVTQKFQAGNSLVTKEKFISDFSVAGKPTILDLSAFLDLSDQKKIDKVFELYPPKGDVMGLHDQIEKAIDGIKELTATIQKKEGIIEQLTADQAEIELPAITLAEVTKEIERTTAEVKLARKNLFTAQQQEADRNAKEKAEAAKKADKEAKAKEAEPERQEKTEGYRPQLGGDPGYTARNSEVYSEKIPTPEPLKYGTKEYAKAGACLSKETVDLAESIKAIVATMDKAGCTSCAAMLVAKRELRKY